MFRLGKRATSGRFSKGRREDDPGLRQLRRGKVEEGQGQVARGCRIAPGRHRGSADGVAARVGWGQPSHKLHDHLRPLGHDRLHHRHDHVRGERGRCHLPLLARGSAPAACSSPSGTPDSPTATTSSRSRRGTPTTATARRQPALDGFRPSRHRPSSRSPPPLPPRRWPAAAAQAPRRGGARPEAAAKALAREAPRLYREDEELEEPEDLEVGPGCTPATCLVTLGGEADPFNKTPAPTDPPFLVNNGGRNDPQVAAGKSHLSSPPTASCGSTRRTASSPRRTSTAAR